MINTVNNKSCIKNKRIMRDRKGKYYRYRRYRTSGIYKDLKKFKILSTLWLPDYNPVYDSSSISNNASLIFTKYFMIECAFYTTFIFNGYSFNIAIGEKEFK